MNEEEETPATEPRDEGSRVPLVPNELISHNGGQLVPRPPADIVDPESQASIDAPENTQASDDASAGEEEE